MRRVVLEQLGAESEADTSSTATVEALANELGMSEQTTLDHLEALAGCELARFHEDGRVRVTITGEELLALDPDELVVIDTATPVDHE